MTSMFTTKACANTNDLTSMTLSLGAIAINILKDHQVVKMNCLMFTKNTKNEKNPRLQETNLWISEKSYRLTTDNRYISDISAAKADIYNTGSAHGSALVDDDDDDDSPVEEMSPVNKPSKRASRAKKNDAKDKELAKDWTKVKEIMLCQAWCNVSENSEKGNSIKERKKSKTSESTSGSAYGGFNLNDEADEYEEAREHRPLGRDDAKAKKKSPASSREGSFSFVDLVADKYLGIKSTKWERMQEQNDSYIQLKNRELDIQKVARKEATDLKREKLKIQRRKLQLYKKKKKRDKNILFYNLVIDPSLPVIQQQKLQEMNDEIKETYNLDY
ncbi:hypothetical protein Tco_0600139 [Tanacetum coccineum]|uniref:No apical meristem-associated C-terminal domain-containing protein n=1 Tax=Tanacetum coccineum TaxID=301880 RepID=A0ABQ4WB22_9ASTR